MINYIQAIHNILEQLLERFLLLQVKGNRLVRTSQLYAEDDHAEATQLHNMRFDSILAIAAKRQPSQQPLPGIPRLQNLEHAAVLAENGINYDMPLTPIQVAQIRAERIAKEKKEQLSAQKASSAVAAAQSSNTAVIVTQATSIVATQSGAAQTQLTVVPATQFQSIVSAATGTAAVRILSDHIPFTSFSSSLNFILFL